MRLPIAIWVAAGAALGSMVRVSASLIFASPAGGFPLATLLVNVAGSFAIGAFAALSGPDGRLLISPAGRQFVMAGFCGGLTTFSIFSLESLELLIAGRPWLSLGYISTSLAGWLVAAWLGHTAGIRLSRLNT